ncbi:hypothetical protein ACOME3_010505 [Neoechinorhynchus agilis]
MKLMDEKELVDIIRKRLHDTGERERLQHLLQQRLIDCGWRDQVKTTCKDIVQSRGLENTTMDELINEVSIECRSLLPDSVKKELIDNIKTFIELQTDLFE